MQRVSETWHLFTSEVSAVENKLSNFNISGRGERQTGVSEKLVLLFSILTPQTGRGFCPFSEEPPAMSSKESENKPAVRTPQCSSTACKNYPLGQKWGTYICSVPSQSRPATPNTAVHPLLPLSRKSWMLLEQQCWVLQEQDTATWRHHCHKKVDRIKIIGDWRNYHTGVYGKATTQSWCPLCMLPFPAQANQLQR